jgi:DNA polymerase (family 10)
LRGIALKKGLSLNEYGFTAVEGSARKTEVPDDIHDEREIYKVLGLSFIEPELRENRGEIEAAAEHKLPRLIELSNLCGTFHNHTTASDGHHTLEEMAEEAI